MTTSSSAPAAIRAFARRGLSRRRGRTGAGEARCVKPAPPPLPRPKAEAAVRIAVRLMRLDCAQPHALPIAADPMVPRKVEPVRGWIYKAPAIAAVRRVIFEADPPRPPIPPVDRLPVIGIAPACRDSDVANRMAAGHHSVAMRVHGLVQWRGDPPAGASQECEGAKFGREFRRRWASCLHGKYECKHGQ